MIALKKNFRLPHLSIMVVHHMKLKMKWLKCMYALHAATQSVRWYLMVYYRNHFQNSALSAARH